MVPRHIHFLPSLPLSANGKVDRGALRPLAEVPVTTSGDADDAMVARVGALATEILGQPVQPRQNLFDCGATSLHIVRLQRRLADQLGSPLTVVDLFRLPTVADLAAAIPVASRPMPSRLVSPAPRAGARCGLVVFAPPWEARRDRDRRHGRPLPGAPDLAAYWDMLANGREGLTPLAENDLLASGVPRATFGDPRYVRTAGALQGIDRFDAGFWGMSAHEASLMDPQQRILLELAWHALEDAGIDPARTDATIGVFVGTAVSTYLLFQLRDQISGPSAPSQLLAMVGNDKDYIATQLAYRLDLRGPAVAVQTACSSSLVAVHLAEPESCSPASATSPSPAASACACRIASAISTRPAAWSPPMGIAAASGTTRPAPSSAAARDWWCYVAPTKPGRIAYAPCCSARRSTTMAIARSASPRRARIARPR